MKQVEYNNSAFTLRLEYPFGWDAQAITDVTVTVKNTSGDELLSATSATLWSAGGVQLNGAVETFDNSLTLEATGATPVPDLEQGDRVEIAESAAGPREQVEVQQYASLVAGLSDDLRFDHSDDTAVVGLWCTYDLDTSSTSDFPLGEQLVITWTPDTDDLPLRQRAEVANSSYETQEFAEIFKAVYPRRYGMLVEVDGHLDDLHKVYREAHRQMATEMRLRNRDINRIVDTELLRPALMAKVAWLSLLTGDDRFDVERTVVMDEYNRQFELVCSLPLWEDRDQDEVEEDSEVEDAVQLASFERGL